jgi:hypothetical protein
LTLKLMRLELPAAVALAARMAARREPGPALPRLLTTNVCVGAEAWKVAAWAAEDPEAKAIAAEAPATRPTAPAIRSMNRLARMSRLFMKTTRVARGNIISPFPSRVSYGVDLQLKVCVVEHTINRADNHDRRTGGIHGKDSKVK